MTFFLIAYKTNVYQNFICFRDLTNEIEDQYNSLKTKIFSLYISSDFQLSNNIALMITI